MVWSLSLEDDWVPLSQQDGGLDWDQQCAQTCLAMVQRYVADVKKTPRSVHDEYWGKDYVGPVDIPAIKSYARSFMNSTVTDYHVSDLKSLSNVLWQALYRKRPVMYLATLDGTLGHWEAAVGMTGGATSYPFDNLRRSDPWFGIIADTSWQKFQQMAYRYYADGMLVALVFDRLRSVAYETRMGP
jgi:hypothetical protein